MLCNMCPRLCNADRVHGKGYCRMPEELLVARAAPHYWEEPVISGTRGSGAVFFSGCNLGCVYCQNYEISHGGKGRPVSEKELLEILRRLEGQGVHNINLVNPTHYALKIARVLEDYHGGLPIVYNSSGYELEATLRLLQGRIDVYLPDLKYISSERSEKYSGASDYFLHASKAVREMKRQCPENIYDAQGLIKKGLIIRHLVLPGNTNQSVEILRWIKNNLGEDTVLSLMSQYTPCGKAHSIEQLSRKITPREYEKVVNEADKLGFTNVFLQERESSDKKFIPDFDFTGI